MENVNLAAVDIAKNSFHLRAVNHRGRAVRDIRVSRDKLVSEVIKLPQGCVLAMEACGGARTIGVGHLLIMVMQYACFRHNL